MTFKAAFDENRLNVSRKINFGLFRGKKLDREETSHESQRTRQPAMPLKMIRYSVLLSMILPAVHDNQFSSKSEVDSSGNKETGAPQILHQPDRRLNYSIVYSFQYTGSDNRFVSFVCFCLSYSETRFAPGSQTRSDKTVDLDGCADDQPTQLIGFLEKEMHVACFTKANKQTKNFVLHPKETVRLKLCSRGAPVFGRSNLRTDKRVRIR